MKVHIFVEKPLATNLEDAVRVADAVQEAGIKLSINYILRHHPIHKIALQVIREEVLGPFQHWSLENFASDDVLLPSHWFWDQSQSGGIHVEHLQSRVRGMFMFDLTGTVRYDINASTKCSPICLLSIRFGVMTMSTCISV